MQYYELNNLLLSINLPSNYSLLYQLIDRAQLIKISYIEKCPNKILIYYLDLQQQKISMGYINIKSKEFIKMKLEGCNKNIDISSIQQFEIISQQIEIVNNQQIMQEQLFVNSVLCLVTNEHIQNVRVCINKAIYLQKYSILGDNSSINNIQIHRLNVSENRQQNINYGIIIIGRVDYLKTIINMYNIDKQFNLDHRYQQIIDIKKQVKQLFESYLSQKVMPIRTSYQYQYNLNLKNQKNCTIINILFYPVFVEKQLTLKLFQFTYQVTNKFIIYKINDKHKSYQLASLHDNFTLLQIYRVNSSLVLCYTMHQIRSKKQIIQQKSSVIMVYDAGRCFTKNIIQIKGQITDTCMRFIENKYDQCQLLIVSNKYEQKQKQQIYYLTHINFLHNQRNTIGNPHFQHQLQYKPLVSLNKLVKLPYIISTKLNTNSQPQLIFNEKLSKNYLYWKICQKLPYFDAQNTAFCSQILKLFN